MRTESRTATLLWWLWQQWQCDDEGRTAFLLGSDDCVRGMENGVANVASEYGRRDGYVYSLGYSDCSSIPI